MVIIVFETFQSLGISKHYWSDRNRKYFKTKRQYAIFYVEIFIILTLLLGHHEKTRPEGAIFTSDLICNTFHFLNAHIYARLKGAKTSIYIIVWDSEVIYFVKNYIMYLCIFLFATFKTITQATELHFVRQVIHVLKVYTMM